MLFQKVDESELNAKLVCRLDVERRKKNSSIVFGFELVLFALKIIQPTH